MGPVSPDVNNTRAEIAKVAIGKEGSPASRFVAEARRIIAEKRVARPNEHPLVITEEAINEASGRISSTSTEGANSDFLARNFGAESSPNADQATQESQAKRTSVNEAIKNAKLAARFDKLTPKQQKDIVTTAEKLLASDPDLKAALPQDQNERRAWIAEHFLGDPRIVAKIQESIAALEAEKPPDDVVARRAEAEKAKAKHEKSTEEANRLRDELGKISDSATDTTRLTELIGKLQENKALLIASKGDLAMASSSTNEFRMKLRNARTPQEIETISQKIAEYEAQERYLRGEMARAELEIEDYDRLTKTKEQHTSEQARIQGELKAAEAREKGSQFELSYLENRLEQARSGSEQALVDRAKGIIPESISAIVNEDLAEAETAYQQAVNEFQAGAKDSGDKAIGRQLYGRYTKERTLPKTDKKIRETDVDLARKDLDVILTDTVNGPRQLLEEILSAGLKAEGFDDNQINEMVATRMTDSAWVETMSIIVGGNALYKVGSFEPLAGRADALAKTKLGKGILDKAMSGSFEGIPPEIDEIIIRARERGIITSEQLDATTRDIILSNIKIKANSMKDKVLEYLKKKTTSAPASPPSEPKPPDNPTPPTTG